MNELFTVYQAVMIDHSRHPRHYGNLLTATHQAEANNPLCPAGDDIKLFLTILAQSIKALQFTGFGCDICIASASLLTEHLQGKTLLQAQDCFAAFLQLVERGGPTNEQLLGKLNLFAQIYDFPLQVKCIMVPWYALKVALIKNHVVPVTFGELPIQG